MADRRAEMADLVRAHQAGVWRYLRYLGCNPTEADDLAQETFLALFREDFEHRSQAQTSAYLRTVARNRLLTARRKERNTPLAVDLDAAETVWARIAGDDSLSDTLVALNDCLQAAVTPRVRQALELQYRDRASRTEIATALEIGVEGVKNPIASCPVRPAGLRREENRTMSKSNDPKREELEDRLIDQALREVLGGETPPDLSDKVLAAAEKQHLFSPRPKERMMDKPNRRFRIAVAAAVATCLVVGICMLTVTSQSKRSAHSLSRRGPDPAAQPRSEPRRFRVDDAAAKSEGDSKTTEGPVGPAISPDGRGPGMAGDQYNRIVENPLRRVADHPLSTFSIDVDTASYANVRRFLLQEKQLPPPDAVRIEELINYFDYDYQGPTDDVPFSADIEVAGCPWAPQHRLVRVGLKGREIPNEQRPDSNLVFLLDVSGSMNSPDKLPLLKEGMKLLTGQLRENDRVAIVVYARSEGLALPSTPGSDRRKIMAALDNLRADGSTAGGAGIELAYRVARQNFIAGGVNRVLLCTDGDFNVGTTSEAALERMVEERAKSGVFLSVLGFGRGNLNDSMMEKISNKGNGNYAYIDGVTEARKVLVEQVGGTLVTIAKDVKIQVEFNPAQVAAYRLIGYENRILAAEDFNDDKKDAGEIGAGHTVTALYEVVPPGAAVDLPSVDPLKYQTPKRESKDQPATDELLTLKLRYKAPDADQSKLLEFTLLDEGNSFDQASPDFRFAAAVASFGMLLRDSQHKGTATYDTVLDIATQSKGPDKHGYRSELLEMVRTAKAATNGR